MHQSLHNWIVKKAVETGTMHETDSLCRSGRWSSKIMCPGENAVVEKDAYQFDKVGAAPERSCGRPDGVGWQLLVVLAALGRRSLCGGHPSRRPSGKRTGRATYR